MTIRQSLETIHEDSELRFKVKLPALEPPANPPAALPSPPQFYPGPLPLPIPTYPPGPSPLTTLDFLGISSSSSSSSTWPSFEDPWTKH